MNGTMETPTTYAIQNGQVDALQSLNTVEAQVDGIALMDLTKRYDIKKSALYTRVKHLGLTLAKRDRIAYVNNDQLLILDNLDTHIKNGQSLNDFVYGGSASMLVAQTEGIPITPEEAGKLVASFQQVAESGAKVADALTDLTQTTRRVGDSISAIAKGLEILENAKVKQWQLTTAQLAAILGLSKGGINGQGTTFVRNGFTFTLQGKQGRQNSWSVS